LSAAWRFSAIATAKYDRIFGSIRDRELFAIRLIETLRVHKPGKAPQENPPDF
jgi:hypothetical protein